MNHNAFSGQQALFGRYAVNGVTPRLDDVLTLSVKRPYEALMSYAREPVGKFEDLLGRVLHHFQRIGDFKTPKGTLYSLRQYYAAHFDEKALEAQLEETPSADRPPTTAEKLAAQLKGIRHATLQVVDQVQRYIGDLQGISNAQTHYASSSYADRAMAELKLRGSIESALRSPGLPHPAVNYKDDMPLEAWVADTIGRLHQAQIRGLLLTMLEFSKTMGSRAQTIGSLLPDPTLYVNDSAFKTRAQALLGAYTQLMPRYRRKEVATVMAPTQSAPIAQVPSPTQ